MLLCPYMTQIPTIMLYTFDCQCNIVHAMSYERLLQLLLTYNVDTCILLKPP